MTPKSPYPGLSKQQLRELSQHDKYSRVFYEPHSIIALMSLVAFGVYAAFSFDGGDSVFNVKIGLIACVFVFLYYCATQFHDTLFVRPHPVFWRVVTGLGVLYLILCVFLLFQSLDDVRQLLKHVDPSLGVPLPERSYGDACTVYTPDNPNGAFANIWACLMDEFVVAHVLGWFAKSMMIRNTAVCLLISVWFELLELTFQHWLPNFIECWWDHIIVDLLTCNALGIWLGNKAVRYMSMREYHWDIVSNIPTVSGKVSRIIGQFGPFSWDKSDWEVLSGPKRMLQIVFMSLVILTNEMNAFFLKFLLWIPPSHPVNLVRLLLWWLLGLLATREFHHYVSDPSCRKLGTHLWVSVTGVLVELLIWIKFSRGIFTQPFPTTVVVSWAVGISAFVAWFIYHFFYKTKVKVSVE